ncbi:MAG: hypothetical protein AAFP23_03050 [Pseudomonadota bacterium]
MQLIGGVMVDGALRRDVTLAPVDGRAEVDLSDLAESPLSEPERVTRFLETTLATVGGLTPDPAALSVGDRQHLVRLIGAELAGDTRWLTSRCGECGEGFDFRVTLSALPVKPAGEGYPDVPVTLRGRPYRLRVPTGADQAAIAAIEDEEAALAALIDRLLSGQDAPPAADLTAAEIARIEAALEDAAPEVATEVLATCHACGAENRVGVDPYMALGEAGDGILAEVHVLARRYHWSEAEILSLPRRRRAAYLALIDRERGMIGDLPGALQGS